MSYVKPDNLQGIHLTIHGHEARVHTFTYDMPPPSGGDMAVTVKGILAQDALRAPLAGETAEYRAQRELIDFAKTGAPIVAYDSEVTAAQVRRIDALVKPEFATGDWVAVESEGNISDVEETPRRVLPRMQTQQPWVGDGIAQNDLAWVDNSPTYSAVLAARDEKHPTRSPAWSGDVQDLIRRDCAGCANAICDECCPTSEMVNTKLLANWRPKSLNAFALEAHANNQHWWHDPATGEKLDRNTGELLMLVVSEIAECMEGERKDLMDTHLPHRKMAEVELADATIRIADIAGSRRLNLDARYTDVHDRQDMPSNKGEALLFVIKPLQSIDRFEGWVFERKIVRTFMRIERYAEKHGYDLWGAVAEKREYNKHRADHKPAARLAANGKKF